jgi:hypothetical protein
VDEKTQEYIESFFSGVMVDGITRKLEFEQEPEDSGDESGRMVVKLIMPGSGPRMTVHLSFPRHWEPPK